MWLSKCSEKGCDWQREDEDRSSGSDERILHRILTGHYIVDYPTGKAAK